jgi:hypothetical protein
MNTHQICDTCETVKHCTQHGCIPAHPSPIARPLTAALMRDDGGEQPAFCVMAAFRQEGDAQALLDMLAKPRADQALVPGAHPKPAAPAEHQAQQADATEVSDAMRIAGIESAAWDRLSSAAVRRGGWPYTCKQSAECVAEVYAAMRAAAAPAAPAEGIRSSARGTTCPITGRPYFMHIEHPDLGMVPTYGGPYDSYTAPEPVGEATQPWHKRELCVHRYDHDEGGWVDDEIIPLKIIHDDVLMALEEKSEAAAAPQAQQPGSAYPVMLEADIVVTKVGRAWSFPGNREIEGKLFYNADQMRAYADATCALRAARAAVSAPQTPTASAPEEKEAPRLSQAELQEVQRAVNDIEDCGETDVAYELLLRAMMAGYLECTRFQVLNQAALDLAAAPQAPAPEAQQHPDDAAVDRFAAAMKAKLAAARAEGRSGWNDPAQCTADDLAIDLRKHVNKGDPVDVANVAMFLHARGESTKLRPLSGDLIDAIKAAPAGTSAIEHGGAVVFISREGDHSAPTLLLGEMNHRELNAEVTEVNYYSGQIILQVTGGREVPQDLAAGAEVDILYQAEEDGEHEGSAA